MNIAIAGAGFSGAVLAHRLASDLDAQITVYEERDHIAGNCHTTRDPITGVMEHHYGPHIFHTSDERVWAFVNRFATFRPFVNRVKAVTPAGLFSLPINLMTINQFFGKNLRPDEARAFVATLGDATIGTPVSFEDQAMKFVGRDLYDAFFRGYTRKQWGVDPKELPAAILQRLPIRFNYDDNYYNSLHQGIPQEGYTAIVQRLLDHPKITVRLGERIDPSMASQYDHLFWTGPIDAFYGHRFGRLGYRTVYFDRQIHAGDYQGTAVINYTSETVPYTRVAEHKHFTPWETHDKTLVFFEYSRETAPEDTPYYPVRREHDKAMLAKYLELARAETKVSFLGRLATYRYLDMHAVIGEALDFADRYVAAQAAGAPPPNLPATIA